MAPGNAAATRDHTGGHGGGGTGEYAVDEFAAGHAVRWRTPQCAARLAAFSAETISAFS